MARPSKPWWWSARKRWAATIDGVRRVAPEWIGKADVYDAWEWHREISRGANPVPVDTVASLFELYLQWDEARVRVSPDGEISEVCAASRQFLESTAAPRSVFVWSAMANAVDPEQIPDENDPSWDDWFDLNVPGLEDLLEPTGLELAE